MQLRVARADEITVADLYAVLCLRADIFVVEQACPYADPDGRDLDPGTTHLWFTREGEPKHIDAYARIVIDPDGAARVGRVCTSRRARGRGLAARLIGAALELTDSRVCVLAAQSHLTGFYERFGFVVDGDEFDEDGIAHTPMRLVR